MRFFRVFAFTTIFAPGLAFIQEQPAHASWQKFTCLTGTSCTGTTISNPENKASDTHPGINDPISSNFGFANFAVHYSSSGELSIHAVGLNDSSSSNPIWTSNCSSYPSSPEMIYYDGSGAYGGWHPASQASNSCFAGITSANDGPTLTAWRHAGDVWQQDGGAWIQLTGQPMGAVATSAAGADGLAIFETNGSDTCSNSMYGSCVDAYCGGFDCSPDGWSAYPSTATQWGATQVTNSTTGGTVWFLAPATAGDAPTAWEDNGSLTELSLCSSSVILKSIAVKSPTLVFGLSGEGIYEFVQDGDCYNLENISGTGHPMGAVSIATDDSSTYGHQLWAYDGELYVWN